MISVQIDTNSSLKLWIWITLDNTYQYFLHMTCESVEQLPIAVLEGTAAPGNTAKTTATTATTMKGEWYQRECKRQWIYDKMTKQWMGKD